MGMFEVILIAGLTLFGKTLWEKTQNKPILHNVLELLFKRYNIPVEEQQMFRQLAGAPAAAPPPNEHLVAALFSQPPAQASPPSA